VQKFTLFFLQIKTEKQK